MYLHMIACKGSTYIPISANRYAKGKGVQDFHLMMRDIALRFDIEGD